MSPAHLRIQIPVFNEEASLFDVYKTAQRAADRLLARGALGKVSCLIIDDGSTDGSLRIAQALAFADPRVEVLAHPRNEGLGRGFREGISRALGEQVDVLLHIDADGQFDAELCPQLILPVVDEHVDLVTASRFREYTPVPPMPLFRRFGNQGAAALISLLAGQWLSDVSCGYRAYSRRALGRMKLTADFTYTHETLLACAYEGLAIREVPLPIRGVRSHGRSRIAPSCTTYGLRAGMIVLRTLHRYRPLELYSASTRAALSILSARLFGA